MTRTPLPLAAVLLLPLAAEAAVPTVESAAPAVGQRGTEFTLTLTGARLTGAEELLLYEPGVVCSRLTATSPTEARATLRAAPDCRLGTHSLRLRSRDGVSEVRTFRITPFPVVEEKEPNDTPRQAQLLPLNVSVAGCHFDPAAPLSGTFTAKLDGLPPRATANPVELRTNAKQVAFTVAIDATTPLGERSSLVCELTGKAGEQSVVYRVGRGGVLAILPPGAVKSDASGKALSPLDVLRGSEPKERKKKP